MSASPRLRAAQIEFSPRWDRSGEIDRWVARPIGTAPLIDRTYGEQIRSGGFQCVISVSGGRGEPLRFWLMTQGREPGGRRYREFTSFAEAIAQAERWAARRFGILAEAAAA